MASIQDGDLLYVRSVWGTPYELLRGDASTGTLALFEVVNAHWHVVQTTTQGRWQIRSRSYGHLLSGGTGVPTVITDDEADVAR